MRSIRGVSEGVPNTARPSQGTIIAKTTVKEKLDEEPEN